MNQDLGIGGKLQGRYLGSASPGSPQDHRANPSEAPPKKFAIAVKCDGSASQQWEFVLPATGQVLDGKIAPPYDKAVQIRHKSTRKLLDVPGCKRAAEPFGPGPRIECGTGAGGGCGGANQLWQVHANGTITTEVDGQCINVDEQRPGSHSLQTFSCARQVLKHTDAVCHCAACVLVVYKLYGVRVMCPQHVHSVALSKTITRAKN